MKFLIDNNLSFKLVKPIQSFFPESSHVRDSPGVDTDDSAIWNFAIKNKFAILTKDNDFDERSRLFGCPPKIIHLVCGNQSTQYILNMIIKSIESIEQFLETDHKDCILKIS